MCFTKRYNIFERTPEGRLVHPLFTQGYWYDDSCADRSFGSKEEALAELATYAQPWEEYLILPSYTLKGE